MLQERFPRSPVVGDTPSRRENESQMTDESDERPTSILCPIREGNFNESDDSLYDTDDADNWSLTSEVSSDSSGMVSIVAKDDIAVEEKKFIS